MKNVKTSGAHSKTPRWFYIILFMLPLVFLLFLEGGLRVVGYGEDLELFVPAPNAYPDRLTANASVALRYFSKEDNPPQPRPDFFLKQKPKNGYRVFMLGGSTAQGWPYGESMMPSRILARRLSETFPDKNVEVINLAITAINTYTLLDFVDEILEQEPDAVLIYSGHNEYYGALGVGSAKSLGKRRPLVNAYLKLQRFKSFMLLQDIITSAKGLIAKGGGDREKDALMLRMVQETSIPYKGTLYQEGVKQFEENLREIIGRFKAAGVDVLISELVSNLKGQQPFVSVASEDHESADALYRLAGQLERLRRYDKAREAYMRAKDHDALRFRAPEEFNEIIRRLGAEFHAPVVPMKAYFESASPGGIVGPNLMMEHLHPNAEGYFLMSEAFFDTMRREGMIAAQWPKFPEAGEFRKRWGVSEFDHVLARLQIAELKDSWPFKPLELSGRDFKNFKPGSEMEALAMQVLYREMTPIQAHRKLAKEYESRGDIDAALREYGAMIEIFPFEPDLYREAALSALKADRLDDALPLLLRVIKIKPLFGAMKWIGQIHFYKNDLEKAIFYFEKARALDVENDLQLISLMGQAYERTGQQEKAEKMKTLLPDPGETSPK